VIPAEARIRVRVSPRAERSEITAYREGVLLVRLPSPPVEGRANEELCRLLARRLRVGRRSLEVVRGARSRDKVLRVSGIEAETLERTLQDLL
jgi:uncharacterized protein